MQPGIAVDTLARKILADQTLKADYIADTSDLRVDAAADGTVSLFLPNVGNLPIRPLAHDQIGLLTAIPAKYYDRMLDNDPALLAANVNRWLPNAGGSRMVRTLGGDARAVLSDRYHRIDNEDVAAVALPILRDTPGLKIVACEVTERRLYICATTDKVGGEVKVGDTVQAGVSITNSEVGLGAVNVRPLLYRLVCLNGMVLPDGKLSARHVGRRIGNDEDLNRIFSDETRRADDNALLLKVRDVIKHALDAAVFEKRIEQMRELAGAKVTGNPQTSVELIAKEIGAAERERDAILRSFIEGGDVSAWGLVNAVTAQAHEAETFDRSFEFAQAGGKLLTLPPSEWRRVLEAE